MEDLNNTDKLALERTKLANERTFLAYFRTFVVVFASGLTLIKIEIFQNSEQWGYGFSATAVLLLIIGVCRFRYVRKRIVAYYTS